MEADRSDLKIHKEIENRLHEAIGEFLARNPTQQAMNCENNQ